jgi:acyl-CoA synthetase (AMP-forming)/AMP-acid ligase II
VDIGEPDGAGPAAVDRPDAPRAVDGAALREWCRRRIAGYKVPARVCVVAALPRTALGKPRRDVVRRWADESSRERA